MRPFFIFTTEPGFKTVLSTLETFVLALVFLGKPTAGFYGLRMLLLNSLGILCDELGILKKLKAEGLIRKTEGYNYGLTPAGFMFLKQIDLEAIRSHLLNETKNSELLTAVLAKVAERRAAEP